MSTDLRALVVDDEELVRNLTVRALQREGFSCDVAGDGCQALEQLARARYHVVVTDLRMPNKHGHALAVELLTRSDRPLIAVLTGCIEPRLAKDLLARGVEDVFFKPVDYGLLGAKIKRLVERRPLQAAESPASAAQPGDVRTVSLAECERRLDSVTRLLPISQSALEAFTISRTAEPDVAAVAKVIRRDPVLIAELLRLANSGYFNRSGRHIVSVEEAIGIVGSNRVGEIALACSALGVLTNSVLPWLDARLAWERSLAAGIAAEALLEYGPARAHHDGLSLCALMYPLGRLILGTLFSQEYTRMTEWCRDREVALLELERRVFPISHSAAAARLLSDWGVPPEVHEPLRYVADGYATLTRLAEAMRTRVELIKVAIVLGRLAVGRWERGDWLEFPSDQVLARLHLLSPLELVTKVREKLTTTVAAHPAFAGRKDPPNRRAGMLLNYCRLSTEPFDFILPLLVSLGVTVVEAPTDERTIDDGTLINCLGVKPPRIAAHVAPRETSRSILLVDYDLPDGYERYGKIVRLPTSFGRLEAAVDRLVHVVA